MVSARTATFSPLGLLGRGRCIGATCSRGQGTKLAVLGHQERFPPPRLSGRCGFESECHRPSARVFAEHDPAAAAWSGECRERSLCPNPDLPCASRAAERLYAVGVHGRTGAPSNPKHLGVPGPKRPRTPASAPAGARRNGLLLRIG